MKLKSVPAKMKTDMYVYGNEGSENIHMHMNGLVLNVTSLSDAKQRDLK